MIRPISSRSPSARTRRSVSVGRRPSMAAVRSAAAEAVGAGAEVAAGIHRAAAELARWPAGGHHSLSTGAEGAGRRWGETDDQHLVRRGDLLLLGLRVGEGLLLRLGLVD